jgi:hypothetical protein
VAPPNAKTNLSMQKKGKQLWIFQLLHITPSIKLLNEIIQLNDANGP